MRPSPTPQQAAGPCTCTASGARCIWVAGGRGEQGCDCWSRAALAGEQVGRLYDQDVSRLRDMARASLRVCARHGIEGEGTPGQHLRLCGASLLAALAMCE